MHIKCLIRQQRLLLNGINLLIKGFLEMKKVIIQSGGADNAAAKLKEEILNSKDTLTGKNVYYVSNNGDDNYSGTSPDKPIKTIKKANELPLRSNDIVLFERGSVFRCDEPLYLRGGASYGAYGEGEKPIFLGSVRDYADSSLWKLFKENIWEMDLPYAQAGLTNFNNDTYYGFRKFSMDLLSENGDFYHEVSSKKYYLYFDGGNPGEYFDNIEIATTNELVYAQNVNHISVENICFKYGTFGAFNFGNNKEIRVTNCVMTWHGGKHWPYSKDEKFARYGNALQLWYRAKDVEVSRCYIDQVFDAALTFQGRGDSIAEFENIRFCDNLIENCSMNIEVWAGNQGDAVPPLIKDIFIENNIVRFGGYGWGGIQRPDKADQALFLTWHRTYDNMSNFIVKNNIFDCADCYMIYAKSPKEQDGLIVNDNTYYQKAVTGSHNCIQIVRAYDKIATNQEQLEDAISHFEPSYKMVKWIS